MIIDVINLGMTNVWSIKYQLLLLNLTKLNIYQRVIASSTALVSACPKWSDPVTLGGGIIIINFPFALLPNNFFF